MGLSVCSRSLTSHSRAATGVALASKQTRKSSASTAPTLGSPSAVRAYTPSARTSGVMARSAVLRQAYTASGLGIDGGGTWTLPRLLGLARALEVAAFDRPISAEQALAWGLATSVADDGGAQEAAVAMGRGLATRSLHAFALCKRLLSDSLETGLETQLDLERDGIAASAAHPDGQEGVQAFLAKRTPSYVRP